MKEVRVSRAVLRAVVLALSCNLFIISHSFAGSPHPRSGQLPFKPAVPSRLVGLCERALYGSGVVKPRVRAMLHEPRTSEFRRLEQRAYYAFTYDLTALRELAYYPDQYLSIHFFRNKRVLDLNCGYGYLVEELRRAGVDAIGLDVQLTRYQLSKPYFMQASAADTGLPERSADIVISSLGSPSLFFSSDPEFVRQILLEVHRVLRKGGVFLISSIDVPLDNPFQLVNADPNILLRDTVFGRLPSGLRIKNAPELMWLRTYRDPEQDAGRPRRANYWLELERID